jgi:hypothetical protein
MNRSSSLNGLLIWRPVLFGLVLLSVAILLLDTEVALTPFPSRIQCKPASTYQLIKLGLLAIFHSPLLSWQLLLRPARRSGQLSTYRALLDLRMPIATWGVLCLSVATHYWPLISQTSNFCNHS